MVPPISRESLGVPVTVTFSEVFTVNDNDAPILYVPFVGTLTLLTIGAVWSSVAKFPLETVLLFDAASTVTM